MIDTDVYGAAALAGGADRMVDAALAELIRTGQVRAARDGTLTAVGVRERDGVEGAVLTAVGDRGRTVLEVRPRARADRRVAQVLDALIDADLMREGRWGGAPRPTAAGRRRLRELRLVAPASSAMAVALNGPVAMADAELRSVVFLPPPRPATTLRRRRRWSGGGTTSGGAAGGWGCGMSDSGSSCGGGGGGCGGGSG
jgi:uncharacterized membrane protein YgcG